MNFEQNDNTHSIISDEKLIEGIEKPFKNVCEQLSKYMSSVYTNERCESSTIPLPVRCVHKVYKVVEFFLSSIFVLVIIILVHW